LLYHEQNAEANANGADHHEDHADERVLATKPRRGGENQRLGACRDGGHKKTKTSNPFLRDATVGGLWSASMFRQQRWKDEKREHAGNHRNNALHQEKVNLISLLLTFEVADVEVGFYVESHHLIFRQVAVDHRIQLPELGQGRHSHPHLEPLGVDAHHGGHHFRKGFVQVLVVVVVRVREEVVRVGLAAVVRRCGRRAVVGPAAGVHARRGRAGVGAAVGAGGGPHARLGGAAGVHLGLESNGLLVLGRVRRPGNAVVRDVLVSVEDDFVYVRRREKREVRKSSKKVIPRTQRRQGKNKTCRFVQASHAL